MTHETPFNLQKHAEVPGGFVEKEALQKEIDTRKIAEMANSLRGVKETTHGEVMSLLRAEALEDDKDRDKEFATGEELLERLRGEDISPYEVEQALSPLLKGSKKFMLEALKVSGSLLEGASSELKSDPEVVLQAVRENSTAIRYAEGEARKDRRIALEVARHGSFADIDEGLKSDKEIVLAAMRKNGYDIKHASSELQEDREVVLEAVKSNPRALEKINPRFLSDKELVLAAVNKDGEALRFVRYMKGQEDLTSDLDVVSAAIRNNPRALIYAHPSVKKKIQEALGITDQQIKDEQIRQFTQLSEKLKGN
jgi:hypothetical protein